MRPTMKTTLPAWLLSFMLPALLGTSAFSGPEKTYEPKPGSAERKSIMEAMRSPVSKYVGQRVIFTGTVKVSGDWATFSGDAAPTEDKPVNDDAAFALELDLFALLRRTDEKWTVLHWGFSGDVGPMMEARAKFPDVPTSLVPRFDK